MDAEQQQPPPPPPSFISALRELEGPVNQDVLGLAATLGSHGDSDGGDDNDDDGGGDGGDGGGEGGEGNTYTESNHSHDSDRNNDTTTAIAAAATPTPTATATTATIATTNTIPTEPVARLRAQLRRAQEHESQLVAQQQQDQLRLQRSRDRLRLLEQQRDVVDQRDRLRRVMSRLSRLNDDSAAPSTAVAYGDRVPRQNSLYDWSPATAAAVDVVAATGEASRQTALVQAVRRHSRFATRTREPSQRHHAESAGRPAVATPFGSATALGSAAVNNATRDTMAIDRERRDMLSRADSYRRGQLDRSLSHTPPVSPVLEHTVKYLSRIRHCATIDDTLKCALDAGFLCKDYFRPDNDFITDTSLIAPPADTSWLAPGAVFSGYQHATSVANPVTTAMHRFRILDGSAGTPPTALPTLPAPSRPWISNPYSTTRSPSSRLPDPHSGSDQDRWPVKVTIHAVDWSTMSLSATMEAYNVPSHPHSHQSILGSSSSSSISSSSNRNASNAATTTSIPSTRFTRTSSITTYLEGEILDFNTHTLLTESFKSSAENDATYWRKLPPFATMSDDDMVHALTSRKWYEQVLGREWILMRWKERCFVKSLHKRTGDDALATASPPSATSLAPTPVMSSSNTVSSSSSSSATTTTTRSSIPLPSQYTTQLQPSPYRIVRNPQTGRAQVEISTDMPSTTSSTSSTSTSLTSSTSTSTSHPPSLPPPLPLPPSSTQQQHATFDDSGCGLTISGFYYVCLRRCDGALEGLYFDPQSSPYQCLRLESLRGGLRGAWAFR